MGQLSFFSADVVPPVLDDLAGLLAAHGQITVGSHGARLSIVLTEEQRAHAVLAECRLRGVHAEVGAADEGHLLVRTERTPTLNGMAAAWTRGAVKSVPDGLSMSAGFLRVWVLAAGHADDAGYLLGLDPHNLDLADDLIAACARAGLAGSYIGVRGGGPGIRVVGHRRLSRLIDTVGTLPAGLPARCYPVEPRVAGFG